MQYSLPTKFNLLEISFEKILIFGWPCIIV